MNNWWVFKWIKKGLRSVSWDFQRHNCDFKMLSMRFGRQDSERTTVDQHQSGYINQGEPGHCLINKQYWDVPVANCSPKNLREIFLSYITHEYPLVN